MRRVIDSRVPRGRRRGLTGRSAARVGSALAAVVLSLSSTSVAPAAQAAGPSGGRLLFVETFTGPAGALPDQRKWWDWSTATYNPTAAFGNIAPGNNERLDGRGNLRIPATPTRGSAIRTRFAFTYGVVSAWIKTPVREGYWPAFWTLNSRPNGSHTALLGEIDVMEAYTKWPDVYHGVGHTWRDSGVPGHSPDNYCPGDATADMSGRFNKYTARVEPGKITYYFNDVPCGTYTKQRGQPWGFGPDVTRPNWIILDLAVGGAGGQQAPASKPARMLVSRVEVRAL